MRARRERGKERKREREKEAEKGRERKREDHFDRGGRAFWFECKSDFPCKKLENVKAIRSRVTEPRERERERERKNRGTGEGGEGRSGRNRETTDRWEGKSNIIAFAKEVANLPFTVGQRGWKCLLERKLFNTNPRTTSGFESVEEDRFQPSTPSSLTYPSPFCCHPYVPLLCVLFSLCLSLTIRLSFHLSLYSLLSLFRVFFSSHRVAESAWPYQSLLLSGYRLSIFIASRSALFT